MRLQPGSLVDSVAEDRSREWPRRKALATEHELSTPSSSSIEPTDSDRTESGRSKAFRGQIWAYRRLFADSPVSFDLMVSVLVVVPIARDLHREVWLCQLSPAAGPARGGQLSALQSGTSRHALNLFARQRRSHDRDARTQWRTVGLLSRPRDGELPVECRCANAERFDVAVPRDSWWVDRRHRLDRVARRTAQLDPQCRVASATYRRRLIDMER